MNNQNKLNLMATQIINRGKKERRIIKTKLIQIVNQLSNPEIKEVIEYLTTTYKKQPK